VNPSSKRLALVAALAVATTAFLEPLSGLHAQGGGRGQQAPVAPRAGAAIDLTGYWVSVVTEDWRFRMVTPPKGNYGGVPLTGEGRRVADSWDAAKDAAAGEQCKAYGAAGLMRMPGRLRIAWENDNTLRIDADAGTQTRLFHFGASRPAGGAPTWQGHSVAQWEYAPAARGRPRTGNLKVVTTGMRPGYLRRNGVPYSSNAVLTEHYDLITSPDGGKWLVALTEVADPQYLVQPFVTTTHFKREADGARWNPTPCE
jgi:hypothetical protein